MKRCRGSWGQFGYTFWTTVFFILVVLGFTDKAWAQEKKMDGEVRVVLVGDTLLADAVQPSLHRFGYDYPLRRLKSSVHGHDLLVGNLEGPITTHKTPLDQRKKYIYKMDAAASGALSDFGFDFFCLANNHALDYGTQGLFDTMTALDSKGMGHFGAGRNLGEVQAGRVVTVSGVRIGFLGLMEPYGAYKRTYEYFTQKDRPGVLPLSKDVAAPAIKALGNRADTVIVLVHWGKNYKGISRSQRTWAEKLVTWGADIVVGHHPHVVQGVDLIKGTPVIYSLGNFAFGTPGRFRKVDPILRHGWVATVVIDKKGVKRLELTAIATDNHVVKFQPKPVGTEGLLGILEGLGTPANQDMTVADGKAVFPLRPKMASF